jgi:hypothetical protein
MNMTTANWKDAAELLGIAAIVASLIFVGFQLRQDQQIALAGYGQSTSAIRAELDIALAEHAAVLVKSNSGIELSDEEQAILTSVIAALWRATQIDYLERGRLGEEDPRFMTDLFAVFLFRNPGARRIWMEESQEQARILEQLNKTLVTRIRKLVIDSLDTLDRLNGA